MRDCRWFREEWSGRAREGARSPNHSKIRVCYTRRMRFTIHADGGARGNPGPAGAGAVVRDEAGKTVASISEFLGHATNNVAEYTALISAFDALLAELQENAHSANVDVFMDSKLVIEQMKGAWKVKHTNMKPLQARAASLARQFGSVSFTHIPREKNGDADALANEAMDRGESTPA